MRRALTVIAIGTALFLVSVASLSVYLHRHKETLESVSFYRASRNCLTGHGQWTTKDGKRTLRQMVIFEEGGDGAATVTSTWPWEKPGQGNAASTKPRVKVEVYPSGIYLDGVRLPTTDEVRVIIRRKDRSLTPLELSPAELDQFTPKFIQEKLESTALWKERMLPLVDPRQIEEREEAEANGTVGGLCGGRQRGPWAGVVRAVVFFARHGETGMA